MHFGLFLAGLANGRYGPSPELSDEIAVHACGAGGVTSFATLIFFATMSLSPIPMRPITM